MLRSPSSWILLLALFIPPLPTSFAHTISDEEWGEAAGKFLGGAMLYEATKKHCPMIGVGRVSVSASMTRLDELIPGGLKKPLPRSKMEALVRDNRAKWEQYAQEQIQPYEASGNKDFGCGMVAGLSIGMNVESEERLKRMRRDYMRP